MELLGKFTPQWFNDTNDADNDAYLVVFDKHKVVGDQSIESWHKLCVEAK